MVGAIKKRGAIKKMKGANSSKWMYMRSTADISLKWNDVCNADITPNQCNKYSNTRKHIITSKNMARIALTITIAVIISLILIPPAYSQIEPEFVRLCPSGCECLTGFDAEEKFGGGKYMACSDNVCGDGWLGDLNGPKY